MARVRHCIQGEDRKDVEFRALISLTELGDIVKYITHDPKLNPGARPHGTKKDEVLAYGQAIVQAFATLHLREIDCEEAIEAGLRNWEDADWRKRQAKTRESNRKAGIIKLSGSGIVPGRVQGTVYMLNGHGEQDMPNDAILVAPFAKPDIIMLLDKVVAIITDHGGSTCHAANIAREKSTITVVGTGNATEVLRHGQKVILDVPRAGQSVEITIEEVT